MATSCARNPHLPPRQGRSGAARLYLAPPVPSDMPRQRRPKLEFHADGGRGRCVCVVTVMGKYLCGRCFPRMVLGQDRRRLQVMSSTSRMCFLRADKRWAGEQFPAFPNSRLICLAPFFLPFPILFPPRAPSTLLPFEDPPPHFSRPSHRSSAPSLMRSANSSSLLPNYWWLGCDRCKRDGWQSLRRRLAGTSVG